VLDKILQTILKPHTISSPGALNIFMDLIFTKILNKHLTNIIIYKQNLEKIFMKALRIYLENSVIGGYFDDEFKNPTKKLFEEFQ
jgi:hypothetical protein